MFVWLSEIYLLCNFLEDDVILEILNLSLFLFECSFMSIGYFFSIEMSVKEVLFIEKEL